MRRTIGLLMLGAVVAAATPVGAQDEDTIRTAVIVYGLDRIDEAAYQRILTAPQVQYVCFQQIMPEGPLPELTVSRARALAAAGKRNIVQIWWGPSWPYPWSKYSFANIALDEAVRADFWREVVDRCIDEIGAENLYGAHLMEETGMQFGTDVQRRSDPDDFDTFEDTGASYDHPFWSGWKKEWYGRTDIPNVIRHEDDFRALVGFGFEDDERWEQWQWHLFDRWVATRLQSGGQVQFARHIHERYPGLKAFTWDGLLWGGENARTNHHLEREVFDGVMTDVYGDPGRAYLSQRAYRLLYPTREIVHFCWGGTADRPTTIADRRQHLTAAYTAGHDVLGFWQSPANFTVPETWAEDMELLGRVQDIPRFEHHPRLLIISARISDIYSLPYSLVGLADFDILPMWEAWDADLSDYDALMLDATGPPARDSELLWDAEGFAAQHHFPGLLDYQRINAFIEAGGAVIIRGRWAWPEDCPLFPVAGGHVHTAPDAAQVNRLDFEYRPEGFFADEIGLRGSYRFGAYFMPLQVDDPRAQVSDAGIVYRHGRGACLMIPYHRNYDPRENYGSEQWLSHRRLMLELVRGFLRWAGKGEVVEECLVDPAVGGNYRHAVSADHALESWYLHALDISGEVAPILLRGTDLLTGAVDPALSPEHPAAVLGR